MNNIFKAETDWAVAHEKIIIVFAVLLAALYGVHLWTSHSSDAAIAKYAAAQQVLQEQVTKNAETAKQLAVQVQQYQQQLDALKAENASLQASVAKRQTTVQAQQHTDQTLPMPQVITRWEQLANLQPTETQTNWVQLAKLGPSDIQNTDKGLLVSDAGARTTLQVLELVPVLQADVKDLQTIVGNKDKQIGGLNDIVTGLNNQVAGLQLQAVDQKTACNDQVKMEKAKARKSKLKWFLGGVLTGAAITARLLI
jgi:hypothetical protein